MKIILLIFALLCPLVHSQTIQAILAAPAPATAPSGEWVLNGCTTAPTGCSPTSSTAAYDNTGSGNNATLNGTPCGTSSWYSVGLYAAYALCVDGGSGSNTVYGSIPNAAALKPAFPFTFSVWFKSSTTPAAQLYIYHSDSGSANYCGFYVGINTSRNIIAQTGTCAGTGSTNRSTGTSSQAESSNTWHFLTLTFTASANISGMLDSTPLTFSYTGTASTMVYSANPSVIGASDTASSAGQFNGLISDVRIYP